MLELLLGTGGQIARSAVGIKKEMDVAKKSNAKWDDWFNMQELIISLLLGAAAGAFAAIGLLGETLDKKFLLACVAAGYAGSDFIQGFITKNLPSSTDKPGDQPPLVGEKKQAPTPPPVKPGGR